MNNGFINITYLFDYLKITRQFYGLLNDYKDSQIIKLFDEHCDNNYKDKSKIDRYGRYCTVIDSNNKIVLETRDPKYPY
jgi:hypothetical protein